MTTYRATRNEPRVGIGNWTGDFRRNELYESAAPNESGSYPPGTIPEYICDYLVSHGVLVDSRVSFEPADSPTPVSPMSTVPKITKLVT